VRGEDAAAAMSKARAKGAYVMARSCSALLSRGMHYVHVPVNDAVGRTACLAEARHARGAK